MDRLFKISNHRTVKEVMDNFITDHADRTAFILKEQGVHIPVTYTQLGDDIRRLGAGLIKMGLKGKHIAVIGPNSYQWFITYMAVSCGVGTIVPLDRALSSEEILNSLILSDTDTIIYSEKCRDEIDTVLAYPNTVLKTAIPMTQINEISMGVEAADVDNYKASDIKPGDICSIVFTSGTTSNAKAVVLSHYNIASNINGLNGHEQLLPEDVNMAFLPYHHCFGLTGQLIFLETGAATAFCDGIRYIQKNLGEYGVSCFFAVPLIVESMHKKVWEAIDKQGKRKTVEAALKVSRALMKLGIDVRRKLFKDIIAGLGGSIRFLISGAAALDLKVWQDFNDFGILTVQGYGLTETSPVIASESVQALKKGSVGKAMAGIATRIDNPDENGVGELWVQSDGVMQGYYKNPEATAEIIQDGWFKTGDYARIDEEGYIFISGRKKNVIVLKNGKNVYPEELESILAKLPYVSELMIWGCGELSDPKIALKIVYDPARLKLQWPDLKDDFSKEELMNLIWKDVKAFNSTMVSFKHIEYLTISDQPMVKTSTAKIKRNIAIAEIKESDLMHISKASKK